ncbi:hypothetical protein F5Y09DRAFT_346840 [Xylaria sp. FL1042]|nr:hypothetical protein F5Y09DRAFT_346840 [Xylaria sp. FL1042]
MRRFDIEELLGDLDVSFVDGLWIALVAVEAAIIVCILGRRVLGCEVDAWSLDIGQRRVPFYDYPWLPIHLSMPLDSTPIKLLRHQN